MSTASIRSGRTELFIEGMGIATGIAFDHDGNLYVGDRSGSIFKISACKRDFRICNAWNPVLPHTTWRSVLTIIFT